MGRMPENASHSTDAAPEEAEPSTGEGSDGPPRPSLADPTRSQLAQWLADNGVDPAHVSCTRPIAIETAPDGSQVIRYSAFRLTSEGHKQTDPDDPMSPATEQRTTPLLVHLEDAGTGKADLHQRLADGIQQAREGRTHDLGDFARYAHAHEHDDQGTGSQQ